MDVLPRDAALTEAGRLSSLGSHYADSRAAGLSLLILCGCAAGALVAWAQFELRLPGHAILRGALPLALGLSLVPRRSGGTVMSAAAGVTLLAIGRGTSPVGPGALTSLVLLGPMLDVTLRRIRSGRSVLLAFALSGLTVNTVAFLVRLGEKLLVPHRTRPVSAWWPGAAGGYLACGLVAGVLAAVLFFRLGRGERDEPEGTTTP